MNGRIHIIRNAIGRKVLLMFFFLLMAVNSFSENEGNEYSIKAMFVLNFMKYVEWPAQNENEKFVIGVAGESEIYDALVLMTTNRQENKKIKIEKITSEFNEGCQILIITRNESKKVSEWVKKYQGKGILIISEDSKNLNATAINLITIKNKIRFEINYVQARRDGVKISSRLADMAVSVQP
jgi:hypothetical protein